MAKKSSKTNHKMLNDNVYDNRFNEKVSYLPKDTVKFEHELYSKTRYIGGMHPKNSLCTITKQVESKSKLYYSVIFDGIDHEVNWIMSHLLVKVENENQVETNIDNIEEENNNEN